LFYLFIISIHFSPLKGGGGKEFESPRAGGLPPLMTLRVGEHTLTNFPPNWSTRRQRTHLTALAMGRGRAATARWLTAWKSKHQEYFEIKFAIPMFFSALTSASFLCMGAIMILLLLFCFPNVCLVCYADFLKIIAAPFHPKQIGWLKIRIILFLGVFFEQKLQTTKWTS